ncbi:MAG: enoyl-CoA hydratase-related protein [Acidimicrobiales bacterium]
MTVKNRNHVASITINRPEAMNAFRGQTCDDLIHAFHRAGYDPDSRAVVRSGHPWRDTTRTLTATWGANHLAWMCLASGAR